MYQRYWKLDGVSWNFPKIVNVRESMLTLHRDEILYHARIHPEQYCNTLNEDQMRELHKAIHYVCSTALDVLADSEKFPEHWLFKHRWGKGKKNQPAVLPNGERITFLTVGGRTSAVVPSLQRKTGAVAKDIGDDGNESPAAKRKRTVQGESESESESKSDVKRKGSKRKSHKITKKEDNEGKKEVNVGRRRSTRSSN